LAQAVGLDKKAATASGAFPASIPLDAQERRVDPRQIRALHHATGVCYLDFTPVMIVTLAPVVGARDLAIGAGDTERYLFAGDAGGGGHPHLGGSVQRRGPGRLTPAWPVAG